MIGEYLDQPDATAQVQEHRWHHTGDIGYFDEDGFLYVVDRTKDLIITGGFNVFSAEVEATIAALPGVRECAVVGVPDRKWGEMVTAVVVADRGYELSEDTVIASVKAAIGSVQAPKRVHFVDTLPKTTAGKIDKKVIRAGRST
ncbi:hypothetical protein GCM10022222_31740 [Amycolatopsis ultiminotia]|uniref:AMP-binding enzyme C-terminal domain-containing protein n=1 Tax=Amycolatopsis ultiminotia TaxID=543629 RepID=A0ABP6W3W8_9PSEU